MCEKFKKNLYCNMLLPTLNYFSTQSPYRWSNFRTHPSKKLAAKPFSQSCATFFVSWSLLRTWTEKSSCNSEILYRLFSRILDFTFSFKLSVTKDGCPLRSSLRTFFPPSLKNRYHFLTFPSFITPLPYTSTVCLWCPPDKHFNNLTYTEM